MENESLQRSLSLSLFRGEQRLNADLADPGAYLGGHSIRASVIIVVIRRVTTVRSLRLPSLNPGSWTSWLPFSARFPLRRQKVGAEIRNKSPDDFDRNPSGLITGWHESLLRPAYQFWNVRCSLIRVDSRGFLFVSVFINLTLINLFVLFVFRSGFIFNYKF